MCLGCGHSIVFCLNNHKGFVFCQVYFLVILSFHPPNWDMEIQTTEQQEQLPEKKSSLIKIGSRKTSFVSFVENIIIGIEKDHKNTELNDIQNDLLEENDDCTSLENVDKISQILFSSSISIFQSRRSLSPTPEDGKTV